MKAPPKDGELTDEEIRRFLRHLKQGPKGVVYALARLADIPGRNLIKIKNGMIPITRFKRARLSHLIALVNAGRLQFRRDGHTAMIAVMVETPVEERLVLHYPAELMRSIARGKDDLPHLRLQPLQHRVHHNGR